MADIMCISSLVQGPLVPPTTLASLPTEVLHEIASYFKDPRVLPDGLLAWESPGPAGGPSDEGTDSDDSRVERVAAHQTIMSLRLACRALHVAASPLLMPLVDVDISQESLDRLDAISRNPLLARGVRALHVNLAFCPADLADSIISFRQVRHNDLDELVSRCNILMRAEIVRAHSLIKFAWMAAVEDPQSPMHHDWYVRRHQAALRPGHEAFSRRHEEQLRLVSAGGFATSLSGAASRMPLLAALRMCDRPLLPSRWDRDPALAFSPDEDLSGWLDAPLTWSRADRNDAERLLRAWGPAIPRDVLPAMARLLHAGDSREPDRRVPGLPPARLLTDLPIGLHRAGVQLRCVDIACLPSMPQSLALLDPGDGAAWAADLRSAFQDVEAVSVSAGARRDAHPHLRADELAELDEYLSTALSPPRLRSAVVSLPRSPVPRGDGLGRRRPIRVGRARILSLGR